MYLPNCLFIGLMLEFELYDVDQRHLWQFLMLSRLRDCIDDTDQGDLICWGFEMRRLCALDCIKFDGRDVR